MRQVGGVEALWRFPVKSMAGERLETAELRWTGIRGDRQYAFHRAHDRTRFPWATARHCPAFVLHRARYADPADPKHSAVTVETPDGRLFALDDPALQAALSAAFGEDVRLIQLGRGAFDAMPVSVVTTATHAAIDAAAGRAVDPRRFRANIVVRPTEGMTEADWHGRILVFGDAPDAPRLLISEPISRCAFITVDPDSAEKDLAILRLVAQQFANRVGVYAATATPGTLRIGAPVFVV